MRVESFAPPASEPRSWASDPSWRERVAETRRWLREAQPLRSEPTTLVLEGGDVGSSRSWQTVETVSYKEAFKRELVEFHAAVAEGREPRTPGEDGLRDVALCQAVIRAFAEGRPVERPSEPAGALSDSHYR